MRKYIICLISILCVAFTSICFAGSNVITEFSGELISVSVVAKDDTEYFIDGAKGHIGLNNEINANATVGDGKDLPAGKYKYIKYVFKNDFTAAGKVIMNDGTEYGSTSGLRRGPVFKKNAPAKTFNYRYANDEKDWGWCKTVVENGKLVVTTKDGLILDEKTVQNFKVNVTLKHLWFGKGWENFDSDLYVKDNVVDEYFQRLDGDTIVAPFIDPPEMENNF